MTLSPWAFAWVTRLYHHFNLMLAVLIGLSLINLSGLLWLQSWPQDVTLIGLAILVIALMRGAPAFPRYCW